jgi:hypothetical protein
MKNSNTVSKTSALGQSMHLNNKRGEGRAELAMHVPRPREAHPVGNTGITYQAPKTLAQLELPL